MLKKGLFFILFVLSYLIGYSQTIYRANTIQVTKNGKTLKNPFTGGFNGPVFNRMDLDNDGVLDLVVVNTGGMGGSKINTFINKNTSNFNTFEYHPKYESIFPEFINSAFVLKDFNRDGILDIIENDGSKFKLYYSYKNSAYSYAYKLKSSLLSAKSFLGNFDLQLPAHPYSVPIVEDIDGDGDLDIVGSESFDLTYPYFKNYQIENHLSTDSLDLYAENLHFGQFTFACNPLSYISNFFPAIVQGLSSNKNPLTPRHNQDLSTWGLDINHDGKWDMAGANENDNNCPIGINIGTKDSAFIFNYDTFFPSYNTPINFWKPIGLWSDFNNDGKKDILITSMMNRDIAAPLSEKKFNSDIHMVSLYTNRGVKVIDNISPHADSFTLNLDTFLTAEHIDVGTNSAPVFFDYNNDGLLDILIPNFYAIDSVDLSSITLYKNVGTNKTPAFDFITNDYLHFKSKHRVNVKIAVGDLNGDKLNDLLITSLRYKSSTAVYAFDTIQNEIYYQTKGANNEATFPTMDIFHTNDYMKYGIANPLLYDADKDGKLDLFVGEMYKIRYHKNLGTVSKPNFDVVTNDTVIKALDIYSDFLINAQFYPMITSDYIHGATNLYFGYQSYTNQESSNYIYIGKIGKATLDIAKLNSGRQQLISPNILTTWIGTYPTISTADINSDSLPDFVLGNFNGGIQFYSFGDLDSSFDSIVKPPGAIVSTEKQQVQVYPNPFTDELMIYNNDISSTMISLYSIDGRLILSQKLTQNHIETTQINPGVYILKIDQKNQMTYSFKVLKL